MIWTLTSEAILPPASRGAQTGPTWTDIASLGCAGQRRGKRSGRRQRGRHGGRTRDPNKISYFHKIPVLIGRRRLSDDRSNGWRRSQFNAMDHVRGGNRREVFLYVRETHQASPWSFSADNRTYELLWVKVSGLFVGVLYHPPKPSYTTDSLLDYVESTVNEIKRDFPGADVVLAGDFNQLSQDSVVRRTGLILRQSNIPREAPMY